MFLPSNNKLSYSSGITQTTLSIGAAVGIAVVIGFFIGVLAGVLLFYCINKCQSQCSKPETPSHQQQQAGPQYEEVSATNVAERTELRENIAYGPMQRIELRDNVAYESVHH